MTEEEQADLEFTKYLEARYYEGLFMDFDKAVLMGLNFFDGDDNEAQS